MALISEQRKAFHRYLLESGVLNLSKEGIISNADKSSKPSREIGKSLAEKIAKSSGTPLSSGLKQKGQSLGKAFESACNSFLLGTFTQLTHLRPGSWEMGTIGGRGGEAIAVYEQFTHLRHLKELTEEYRSLQASLGNGYTITPDVVISRKLEQDDAINQNEEIVDADAALAAALRQREDNISPLMHASVSCKWTLRSDRAQNARTEALNLIRNRKGRVPHIVIVTAEPTPGRIASIALGTGDIDCVYHFALYELKQTLEEQGKEDSLDLLNVMIEGKRLKDISDLPLDLCV